MVLGREKINALLVSIMVIFFCTFDGVLFLLGVTSSSGSLNLYMAFLYIGLLIIFFMFNFSKTYNALKNKDNLIVVILCFSMISIFSITSVFSDFKIKLIRDISYAFLYGLLFIFFSTIKKNRFCAQTFIRICVISFIIILPLISVILGTKLFPRFESIYGTPSLTGNTIAFAASIIILNWKKYFSSEMSIFLIFSSILLIVFSGSRTALALVLFSSLIGFLSTRSLLTTLTNVFFLLALISLFSLANLNYFEGLEELRILSVDDIQIGSISTRLIWINIILSALSETSWIGGFGSGAAESLLGAISHADILQIYFDYSVLGLLVYLGIIYYFSGTIKSQFFIFHFVALFLLGLQNAYFAPIILMTYLSLRVMSDSKNYEKHI